MVRPWRSDGTISVWTTILEEKKSYTSEKEKKNICLNPYRPVISKINCLEENLNNVNCSFENKKKCSNAFKNNQLETQVKKP